MPTGHQHDAYLSSTQKRNLDRSIAVFRFCNQHDIQGRKITLLGCSTPHAAGEPSEKFSLPTERDFEVQGG